MVHQSMIPGGRGSRGSGRGRGSIGFRSSGSTRHQPTLQGRSTAGGHALAQVRSGTIKRSDCFITTACAEAQGLPDDCEQLRVLRRFRDGYVQDLPDGAEVLAEYDAKAPEIVAAIRALPPAISEAMWEWIFEQIEAAVGLIRLWRFDSAYRLYAEVCMELEAILLHPADPQAAHEPTDADAGATSRAPVDATETTEAPPRKETKVEA